MLHRGWAQDKNGNWTGFYSEHRFAKNFFVVADIENGRSEYQIVPIDLDMHNDDHLLRSLQKLAECEVGREFSRDISASNQKYGTKFRYDKEKKANSFYL